MTCQECERLNRELDIANRTIDVKVVDWNDDQSRDRYMALLKAATDATGVDAMGVHWIQLNGQPFFIATAKDKVSEARLAATVGAVITELLDAREESEVNRLRKENIAIRARCLDAMAEHFDDGLFTWILSFNCGRAARLCRHYARLIREGKR